ncbi:protein of unknown function [[Clostridium] ultunense Esp]|uniref:Uncharacterized protein n=1 Tax=[Clostridium] ultunense Esp TaxID=1288971 RepID=A0A1M4PMF9_9FIRM|nr:protein of unknown function [[Clostridium] ultunense Esp]
MQKTFPYDFTLKHEIIRYNNYKQFMRFQKVKEGYFCGGEYPLDPKVC